MRAMNKEEILLEINAGIAAMLDSKWSYFSAPSYMKGVSCWRYNSVPLIRRLSATAYTTCFFITHIYGFFVHIYMRVCKKMAIYLGIKRKYTWQKNARISCSMNDCKYMWEKPNVYRVIILKQMADHDELCVPRQEILSWFMNRQQK